MQILIYRQDGNLGPYSLEELRAQLAAGKVQPDDLAWHEGMSQWEPVPSLLVQTISPGPIPALSRAANQSSISPRSSSDSGASPATFFHQAATCSVWILLFPIVVQFFEAPAINASSTVGDPHGAALVRLFFTGIIGLAMLTGVILGVIALFGIPKYGTKGILVKSLFGIIVPVALLLLSIPVIIHAQERAAQIRAMQESSSASGN